MSNPDEWEFKRNTETLENVLIPKNKDRVKEHIKTVEAYDHETILDIKAKLRDLTYSGMMQLATEFAKIIGLEDVNDVAQSLHNLSELDVD